jgi:ferritin-like metal-binding protein YciE
VPTRLSNRRDLFLQLLGDALYVERRLAGEVLPQLVRQVEDAELRAGLEVHLEETRGHVSDAEATFLAVEAAPSAGYSDGFEGLVRGHEQVSAKIVPAVLADVFHAAAAAQTEHYELAVYGALIAFGRAHGFDVSRLESTLKDEERALRAAEKALRRLAGRRP